MRYDDLDTKEDAITKKYILRNIHHTVIINNDPMIYIRFIHKNNTSVYVDPNKTRIVDSKNKLLYSEHESTSIHKRYVDKIKKKYYDNVK